MTNSDRWNRITTTVVAFCSVLLTFVIVHREFKPSESRQTRPPQEPTHIKNWQQYMKGGVRVGSPQAPVTVVVFSDFQCPACARFAHAMVAIRQKYPKDVSFVYRYFPLSYHGQALAAAHAAECANREGRFEAYHDLLFRSQQLIGKKSWSDFALEAGIANTARFTQCLSDSTVDVPIRAGVAAGKEFGLHGTPTVIVDGVWVPGPDEAALTALIATRLKKSPHSERDVSDLAERQIQRVASQSKSE